MDRHQRARHHGIVHPLFSVSCIYASMGRHVLYGVHYSVLGGKFDESAGCRNVNWGRLVDYPLHHDDAEYLVGSTLFLGNHRLMTRRVTFKFSPSKIGDSFAEHSKTAKV